MKQTSIAGLVGEVEPSPDCPLCPRLRTFREDLRVRHPDWHNSPVPSFGADTPKVIIVGLAPGLQGANRTGRPFTGDWAGDLLYETLAAFGFSEGSYEERPDDGLRLIDATITNAVRCVPPQNKPTGVEIATCRQFLQSVLVGRPGLLAVLALGRIAHDSILRALGVRLAAAPFAHGAEHKLLTSGGTLTLFDSYHCSRYNTNTGVLTPEMFRAVFARIRALLDGA